MAEEKRITISRTLNGKIIYFIARNSTGKIIARELTQEKLEIAIKIYREPPPVEENPTAASGQEGEEEPKEKKFLTNKLAKKVQKRKKEQETKHLPGVPQAQHHLEGEDEEKKKFLENELKTKVQEKREQSKKKSFWDKLK